MCIRDRSSSLFGSNAPYVEELYEQYLADPSSVPESWRAQFDALPNVGGNNAKDVPHSPIIEAFAERAKQGAVRTVTAAADDGKQLKVLQYIRAHRVLGSRQSQLDPLKRMERDPVPELEFQYYGFTDADLQREFATGSWQGQKGPMKFGDIVNAVKKTYCGTIGIEYMYISATEEKRWIQKKFEGSLSTPSFTAPQKLSLIHI